MKTQQRYSQKLQAGRELKPIGSGNFCKTYSPMTCFLYAFMFSTQKCVGTINMETALVWTIKLIALHGQQQDFCLSEPTCRSLKIWFGVSCRGTGDKLSSDYCDFCLQFSEKSYAHRTALCVPCYSRFSCLFITAPEHFFVCADSFAWFLLIYIQLSLSH